MAAERVHLLAEVERAMQAQLQEESGVTDAKVAAAAQNLTTQLSTLMSQSQEPIVGQKKGRITGAE